MTQGQYFRWMKVWEWFATHDRQNVPEGIFDLLNEHWQLERDVTPAQDLQRFAAAWSLEKIDFANDPEYQDFEREMRETLRPPKQQE